MLVESKRNKSYNPLLNAYYDIPENLTDRERIDAFLATHSDKPVVVVQGLGFVGAVMSLVVANAPFSEYAVIGVDLPTPASYWKIKSINEGQFPITSSDPKVEELYQSTRKKGNFLASFDPYAYSKADVIIVDINLDVDKQVNGTYELEGYDVDLTPFKKAIATIGEHCKPDALILVETTVPVGTCANVVRPIIFSALEERGLPTDQIRIGHSYERVMPGPEYVDSIQNFYRVFSGTDEASAAATEKFLRSVIYTDKYPLTRLGNTNATEMAKVLENSFRAMNIAFMVEWTRFAEEANVNLYEVVRAIRMRPTHKNIMLPGIGVGGYCLPKDPLLASWSKVSMFGSEEGLQQSERGVRINDQMPRYAFAHLQRQTGTSLAEKKVLMLGVSYRQDVGDTRYTPVEPFYDALMDAGCQVFLHDPYVSYWEEKEQQISQDLDQALAVQPEILVFSTAHSQYKTEAFINHLCGMPAMFIYDSLGLLSDDNIQRLAAVHTIKVLGRGDI